MVNKTHLVQWKRPEINLSELAQRRWLNKWSVSRLAKHFDRSGGIIKMRLREVRAGGLKKLDLKNKELIAIQKKVEAQKIFRGI